MTVERASATTLITLFRQTSKLMVDELTRRLRAAGDVHCTPAHHPVFENIDPEGTRLTVLAERAAMTHQSMSELVSTMAAIGYLERVPDPADGRAKLVRLTPHGRQMVRLAVAEIADIEREWLDRFRHAGFDVDVRAMLDAGLQLAENRTVEVAEK
jgi:DNA-binding MarR family transcriptional regulator